MLDFGKKERFLVELITITKDNLEQEHICCAISNHQDCQVVSKKKWLAQQLEEGLVFTKGNVRGKCFIEYIPAEQAWAPIEADGYMYINCLWVSGQYKGKGYSNQLLESCINDSKAKGKKGLVILSGHKKLPFLSDPRYLKYKGFKEVDEASPYFKLWMLSFSKEEAELPRFKSQAKVPHIEEKGFVLYYTHQCPFTAKYVPMIEQIAKERNVPFHSICIKTKKEAQEAPSPFTTYSLFYEGNFISHEILSDKKFEKLINHQA